MRNTLLSFLLFVPSVWSVELPVEAYAESVHTACNNLEDGEHFVRFMEGTYTNYLNEELEFPNVKVRCKDGWTILDYELDNTIEQYFTTFAPCTEYAASSALDDRVSWIEWWRPYKSGDQFAISNDCQTCEQTQELGDMTAFYMTGNYIGCLWMTKGVCDMDTSSLECYECSADARGQVFSGLCTHMVVAADTPVYTDHDLCVQDSFNQVPALGIDGRYCQCIKPQEADEVVAAEWNIDTSEGDVVEQSPDTRIEMWAKDFEEGSYIITEPGTYVLMEDVVMEMNEPESYEAPNGEDAWWPRIDQNDEYEGSYGFVGAYSMGFFAGIAISAHDVTIDLNGHELAMSEIFRLQQRWFSVIEIGSKAFISGQGPGNFGAFLGGCTNIVIKNGALGLSSHHGIHSNFATNVEIRDLRIYNFEVAGIAMNGYDGLIMENLDIGPSDVNVPVLGVYTQARTLLPRIRVIAEDNPHGFVDFHGRPRDQKRKTMQQLTRELESQMDMVFRHVVQGINFRDDDKRWMKAKKLFINDLKIPSASTVYGIFMNAEGASVFAIAGAPGESKNAVVRNIKIHDLINDPWEVPRVMNTKGPMNDIVDITKVATGGLHNWDTAQYTGNAYTDCQYALYKLATSWAILSHSSFKQSVDEWISQGVKLDPHSSPMKCNNDIMLHVTKGVFGLRVDSAKGFVMENIDIDNLHNIGIYGDTVCGKYESEIDGGHRNQKWPLQHGYTGTEVHGLCIVNSEGTVDNVKVSRVMSARGDAFGVQIFPGNDIEVGKIEVSDIHAGAYAKGDKQIEGDNTFPNKIPRACAISKWSWYSDEEGTPYGQTKMKWDRDQITARCVSGIRDCGDSQFDYELTKVEGCSKVHGDLVSEGEFTPGHVYAATPKYAHIVEMLKKQKHRMGEGDRPIPLWLTIVILSVAVLFGAFVICKIGGSFLCCLEPKNTDKLPLETQCLLPRSCKEESPAAATDHTPLVKKSQAYNTFVRI